MEEMMFISDLITLHASLAISASGKWMSLALMRAMLLCELNELLLLHGSFCCSNHGFLLDNSWFNSLLNNWLSIWFMNHGLWEFFPNLSLVKLFLNDFFVLLMNHRLWDVVDDFFVGFMDYWLMDFSDLLLVNDWNVSLMNDVLMLLMNNVFVVLMNNILMMLVDNVFMMFLNNRLSNMSFYFNGKSNVVNLGGNGMWFVNSFLIVSNHLSSLIVCSLNNWCTTELLLAY